MIILFFLLLFLWFIHFLYIYIIYNDNYFKSKLYVHSTFHLISNLKRFNPFIQLIDEFSLIKWLFLTVFTD